MKKRFVLDFPTLSLWMPRILMMIFIVFINIPVFSLTADSALEWAWTLFFWFIPTCFLLALYALAWKKPLWGGIAFVLVGIVSLFWYPTYNNLILFMAVTGPLLSGGILYILQEKMEA